MQVLENVQPRLDARLPAGTSRQPLKLAALIIALALTTTVMPQPAHADGLSRANAAYARGDYVRAVRELGPLVRRGNPKALAMLGYMYEHGYGAPQFYDAAADLYLQAASQGNPFAQGMLGLMYDKGQGVQQNFVLAYMWLDLAAARSSRRERSVYARFRDAIASKMTADQVADGQRLAYNWTVGR